MTGLSLRERLATIAVAVKASGFDGRWHQGSIMRLTHSEAEEVDAEGWWELDYTQDRLHEKPQHVTAVCHPVVLGVKFALFYDRAPTIHELAAKALGQWLGSAQGAQS